MNEKKLKRCRAPRHWVWRRKNSSWNEGRPRAYVRTCSCRSTRLRGQSCALVICNAQDFWDISLCGRENASKAGCSYGSRHDVKLYCAETVQSLRTRLRMMRVWAKRALFCALCNDKCAPKIYSSKGIARSMKGYPIAISCLLFSQHDDAPAGCGYCGQYAEWISCTRTCRCLLKKIQCDGSTSEDC